jgi:hypothetical protein
VWVCVCLCVCVCLHVRVCVCVCVNVCMCVSAVLDEVGLFLSALTGLWPLGSGGVEEAARGWRAQHGAAFVQLNPLHCSSTGREVTESSIPLEHCLFTRLVVAARRG